ncbi:OLC1v1011105C1 [Oldenlandia corymbosa var. corymbosa]|uniref:RING-type E3 ubiquitin transferase n=1 Tax=Oldenlandia corymbosa var. corymbosa TaxID=529605 RepID=A0AAV1DVN7_OLDCO|nr:OLC1v1011105C1 [Oldenlandia corymbosa var. corymbosa]
MVFKKKLVCYISSIFGPIGGWQRAKASGDSDNVIDKASRLEDDEEELMEEKELCCVCLSRLNKGDEEKRSLPCGHEFHGECIESWLSNTRRKTCPVCRFLVEDGEEESIQREFLTDEMMVWFSSFHVAGF